MPKIFGREAVAVPQPDNTEELYLLDPIPAPAHLWRSWRVTSADGHSYTVSQTPDGRYVCDCPAATRYTKYGCTHIRGAFRLCKHAASIFDLMEQPETAHATDSPTPD